MSFSWVPFYRELAGKVLEFEDRQVELIAVLREMQGAGLKTVPIEDDLSRTERVPFTEIDPFTFMATFSRSGDKTATELCAWIGNRWNLETPTPTDFDGRANVAAVGGASWFFTSTEEGRTPQDIPLLWELAEKAYQRGLNGLSDELYEKCVMLKNVGVLKLSTGLFWFNPSEFLPLVGPMLPYLRQEGLRWNDKRLLQKPHCKFSEYISLMNGLFGADFVMVSSTAWHDREAKQIKIFEENKTTINEDIQTNETVKMPLNQILYGPPGTGKTYNSIRRAVEIIDGEIGDNPKARFEELRKAGRIEFVTFHQSFSYEEFIEGLRPLIGEESGQVSYEIRAGILKKIVLRAIAGCIEVTSPFLSNFEEAWDELCEEIGDGLEVFSEWVESKTRYRLSIVENGIRGKDISSRYENRFFVLKKELAEDLWNVHLKRTAESGEIGSTVSADVIGESAFYVTVINEIHRISNQWQLTDSEIAQRFLADQIRAKIIFNAAPHFVLIIDEINRGNISKILGELITLLEDNKRIGMENELRLTLPTSGETFALPPNLYILGTMNTSDKSLAQLDVALRRRFEFEELAPDFRHCSEFLRDVLEELNKRLEWALDREHRLGHAYFMQVTSEAEFDAVFRSKILPLLLEYFPHDFHTLGHVLGAKGKGFLVEMKKPDGFTSGTKYRWWFEEKVTDFSAFAQLKSNYGL